MPALHLTIAVPRKPDGSLARPELQQTIFGTAISSESAGFIDALQTGSVEMSGIAPGHYELTQGEPPRIADLSRVEPASRCKPRHCSEFTFRHRTHGIRRACAG